MKKSIKILAIGNSFSIDAMEYLWHILRAGGVEEIVLGDLFIGGCPVSLHAQNIKDDAHTYIYLKNTDGVWRETPEASLTDGLLDEDWDIVTLQQASHDSGLPETYVRQDEVLGYIKANRPHARIYWHMTWAYQGDSTHPAFPRYGCDQTAMYQAILNAVQTEVLTRPAYAGILPVGTVIQNLRATPLGDTLTRDGFHLSLDFGRYAAALTWASVLCDIDPDTVDWLPSGCTHMKEHLNKIRKAVKRAIFKPFC